jgi:single-stranded DNA-binding protein
MKGFSAVNLSGNLTKDPFIGQNYVRFTVAVETAYKTANGFQKLTNFVPVVAFGNVLETASKLQKGDYVIINGSIRSKVTDDKRLLINVSASRIIKVMASGNANAGDMNDDGIPINNYPSRQAYQQPNARTQQRSYPQNNYGNKPYQKNTQYSNPQQDIPDEIPFSSDGDIDDAIPF